jgi:hypothetical protein
MSGVCLDLSGFKWLFQSQKLEYQQSFALFGKVQNFNSNISTLRAAGDSNLSYYQFANTEEKTRFLQGRFLHIQAYPGSNFPVVEQN